MRKAVEMGPSRFRMIFAENKRDLDITLKIMNPTNGLAHLKKVLSDQEVLKRCLTVLSGTQRNITGVFPGVHDRILHVLPLNETCRYYADQT